MHVSLQFSSFALLEEWDTSDNIDYCCNFTGASSIVPSRNNGRNETSNSTIPIPPRWSNSAPSGPKDGRVGIVEDATAVIAQVAGCEESEDAFSRVSGIEVLVDLLDPSTVSALLNLARFGGEGLAATMREMGMELVEGIADVAEAVFRDLSKLEISKSGNGIDFSPINQLKRLKGCNLSLVFVASVPIKIGAVISKITDSP